MVALLVLLTIIACLTVDHIVQRRAMRATVGAVQQVPADVVFAGAATSPGDRGLLFVPAGAFLAPGHTWLRLEPAGTVRVGTAQLPLTALGGVDGLELPPAGADLRAGDTLAVLHRGNRTLHLRSPLDGVVESVNDTLQLAPAAVRESPYDAGWLLRLRPRKLADALRGMTVAEEAREWLGRELVRLRDCVAAMQPAHAMTLADGGLPVDGFAAELGDEEWRQLEERFFAPAAASRG